MNIKQQMILASSTRYLSRFVGVFVVVFLGDFLWCSGDLYIRKHMAKLMTPQAASVSLGVFVVLKEGLNEILGII
jgi:hypothetical protein